MTLRGRCIGVTGASGFLGSHIIRALELAGSEPVAIVRSPERARFLGVETRTADLGDRAALTRAFAGLDSVVSCAALYSLRPLSWGKFSSANIVGTENVYRAMAEAGVGRAIQISTWGIYRFQLGTPMDEDTPQVDGERKQGGGYRASKQISERRAWELSDEHGIGLTVLRPGGKICPRDRMLLPKLRMLARLPISPAPSLTASMVYAGDVASAVASALMRPASAGRAYNVGGPDETFASFMRALHRADPRARGFALPLPFPATVQLNNARAAKELSFSNRSFEAGLFATFAELGDEA